MAGNDPATARRATVPGRPIEHNRSPKTDKAKERIPWLGMHLVFRPPPTAHIAWALMDDEHRRVLELCQDVSVDMTLEWVAESVAQIRWKGGGKHRAGVREGLIIAAFRHYESRAAESKPLLHDHALVSVRVRRPDDKGTWGNLSADSILANFVAADTLSLLFFIEEVAARLGWAWEPREVTPGRRPVMEIAGSGQRLIGWQSPRRQQIEDATSVLMAKYEKKHGHAPGERAGYALACQAADRTRPPQRTELRSLSELRMRWRESAIAAFGADVVSRLAQRARGGRGGVGEGTAGGRRRPGGRRCRGGGVRDARCVQAPPPARRSAPLPLLRSARPTPRALQRVRRLHPARRAGPGDDRRPASPAPARHRRRGRAVPTNPQADRSSLRAGPALPPER
ncbi:MobF family relaxase [Streptomyces sp. CA-294286]|uniref:MobF family relaxase n=1 Tax=Streptomyces sp. CA-294286 TaxID=3240070 RepID=UPI003D8EDAB0